VRYLARGALSCVTLLPVETVFTNKQLQTLRAAVGCAVLDVNDSAYETARKVWNGMIDRRPLAIVRCSNISDVMQAVRFAREQDLPVSVRGGGHSVPGKAVADGALMIDLSRMKSVHVEPSRQIAIAQAGVTWGEFDGEAEKFQLATTGGVISSTGIAGLTLGGGIGWLMGKHGLACDNLLSADVVSAEGKHMSANTSENEDLFWAIRGGGGNFGVVTAFEYRLHRLESVYGGIIAYPRRQAMDLLRRYRDITLTAPDELTAYAALITGHGEAVAAIAMCHSGQSKVAEKDVSQVLLDSAPMMDVTGRKKYSEVQSMLDATAPAGLHYYFTCPFLRELTDEAIQSIVEHCASAPTEQTQVVIEHMHGAASRVPEAETAFGLRRVQYSINIMPAWDGPALTEKCITWARNFAADLRAFGAMDAYVNYLGDEGIAAIRASYGNNYERLAHLKRKYDPENFFCFNQNIAAAV
jgi:FAD/FMN-containing dehydrogenase